jgi:hypothetical protein
MTTDTELRKALDNLKQTFLDGTPTLAWIIAFVTLGFVLGWIVAALT